VSQGLCRNCNWWTREEYDFKFTYFWPTDPDTYERRMEFPFTVCYCKSPRLSFFEHPVEPDGATLLDGSEYWAGLVTGPEFGCVHWQEKQGDAEVSRELRD